MCARNQQSEYAKAKAQKSCAVHRNLRQKSILRFTVADLETIQNFFELDKEDKSPLRRHIPEDPDKLSTPEERVHQIETYLHPIQTDKILDNTFPYDYSLKKLNSVKRAAIKEIKGKIKGKGKKRGDKDKVPSLSVPKPKFNLADGLYLEKLKTVHRNQLQASNERVRNVVDFMFRSKADQFEYRI